MSTTFSHFFEKSNQISPLEGDFTEVLGAIALVPKILYFRGKLPENMSKTGKRPKTVAIVGSRHNTRYGEEVAYDLAYKLAKKGVVVISGLAYGIDTIAHRGYLDAGGTTVAVLGTRIDDIYPKEHLGVARNILEKGAIISEYAPASYKTAPLGPAEGGWDGQKWFTYDDELENGVPPVPYKRRRLDQRLSFLQRNRLISGLADVVVVVEAAVRSGSLSTATHALNQGKDVFAVPGNITSPYSQGCNRLICEGAYPYSEPSDVLRLLFPEDFAKKCRSDAKLRLFGDNEVETRILQAIATGHRSAEKIMELAKLPPEVFNQAITLLEIKTRVRSLGMNTWSLA